MKYLRRVIRITGQDSPNVAYAEKERALGLTPSGRVLVPGVLTYEDYQRRLQTWDKVRITIGIHAQFYEGAETLLYPPDWLDFAERYHEELRLSGRVRRARAIGVDPAEGGDKTAMAAVDEWGLIELVSQTTPDTTVVTSGAIAFMRKHAVPPERICFDRGGGGKEHADRLRSQGYNVRTVAFGEAASPEPNRGMATFGDRVEGVEERYAYKNRRAEMYGLLRRLLDPSGEGRPVPVGLGGMGNGQSLSSRKADGAKGFGLPREYAELRRQLSPLPLLYDPEGRLYLPPKRKKEGSTQNVRSLEEILGCSPDEADALVLAVYSLFGGHKKKQAGVLG